MNYSSNQKTLIGNIVIRATDKEITSISFHEVTEENKNKKTETAAKELEEYFNKTREEI